MRVITQIVEAKPCELSAMARIERIMAQTPAHGAVRTTDKTLVKAYRNWVYRVCRQRDPNYREHAEKHDGYWLLFKDVREAEKYFLGKESKQRT